MRTSRCARCEHLLGHDIAFQMRAFMAAIFLGPGHPDPAFGTELAAELARKRSLPPMRREGPGFDLLMEKGANLLAQFLGLGRQLDRIKTEAIGHRCLMRLA